MILAAVQTGVLELSCEACQSDPEARAALGCEEPAQTVVWETEEDQFYSCPLSFISPAVWNWYAEQAYYKEYGSAPAYNEQSALWLDAWAIYSSYYSKFLQQAHKKNEDGTSKSLDVLRSVNKETLNE